jgi:hypothetical protein
MDQKAAAERLQRRIDLLKILDNLRAIVAWRIWATA